MIFGIFIALMLAAIAYFHWVQGLFSGTISAVIAVIAAVVAVSYQESLIEGPLAGVAPNWMPTLILLGLFALVYLILRTLFDKLIPGGVQLPAMYDKVGGAVMGLVAGAFGLGVAVIAAQHLPFSPSLGGYVRYETQGERTAPVPSGKVGGRPKEGNTYDEVVGDNYEKSTPKALIVPVDDMVVATVAHLSDNGSLSAGKPFKSLHPDYLQELFGARLGIERASTHVALNTDKKQMVDVTGIFVAPEFDEAHFIDAEYKRTRGSAQVRPTKLANDEMRVIVRVKFDKDAADSKDKRIRLSPASVRLVTMRPGGVRDELEPYNYYPIGTLEVTGILYVNKIDDTLFIDAAAKKVDGSGDAAPEVDFVFQVKESGFLTGGGKGSTPHVSPGTFLEVKKFARVDLSGAVGEIKGTMKPLSVVAVHRKHLEIELGPPPPVAGKTLATSLGAPPATAPAEAAAVAPAPAPAPAPTPAPAPNAPAPDETMSRIVGTWENAEHFIYTFRLDGTYAVSQGTKSNSGTWKITGSEQDGKIATIELISKSSNKSELKFNLSGASSNPAQIERLAPPSPSPFLRKS